MFQQSSSASHTHATVLLLALVAIAVCCSTNNVVVVHGLSTRSSTIDTRSTSTSTTTTNDRRSFFKSIGVISGSFGVISGSAAACLISMPKTAFAQETEMRQGIEVNAFNGLAFNYRGGKYDGLDASTLNEPSISYKDFNTKLKSNEVELVEFMAPDGDVAYVTLKGSVGAGSTDEETTTSPSNRIRIGEGYPLEQHDGFSSPMFCVRTVKNAGVPYKFVVKGLEKYAH
jgi:hypothetical protein